MCPVEFKIGRKKQQSVADDVLLKKKDELIATLRTDLDQCRLHAKEFVDKLDEREKIDASHGKPLLMPTTVETEDGAKEEVSTAKETTEQQLKMALVREDEMKEHLLALQSFAGVDFVPATTKVSGSTYPINIPYSYIRSTPINKPLPTRPSNSLTHTTPILSHPYYSYPILSERCFT